MGVSRVLLIHLMLFSCGDSRNIGKHWEIEGIRIFKKKKFDRGGYAENHPSKTVRIRIRNLNRGWGPVCKLNH